MKSKLTQYSIIAILLLAAVLRLWNLGINPPSLTPDEAALGYNAYSILKTGRDEYGTLLPIIFKSFGDWKPGLYIYATVPFIATFGLTEFAVRLPSALAGVAAVYLLYRIVLLFFAKKKPKLLIINYQLLAIISALMLAISPWHIHFSRGAWEVNLALTLTLAGIYFFLRALQRPKLFIPTAVFFALTLITYQGAKLSVLLVIMLLTLVYWKEVRKLLQDKDSRKSMVIATMVGLVIAIPIFLSFFQGQTGRLKVFSVFSYKRPAEYLEEQLQLGEVEFGSPEYYLYYSEGLNITRGVIGRWFNHFSGRFLFFEGDWQNPRHAAPDTGQLLLADMLFLIVGLGVVSKLSNQKGVKFILAWLILAPLPSAFSRDQVHAVRALNLVIPLTVITAFGVTYFIDIAGKLRKVTGLATNKPDDLFAGKTGLLRFKPVGIIGFVFALYLGSMVLFLDNYFVHQPAHNSQYWEYGYKQVVETVTPIQNDYEIVHVRQSFAQPYIFFLFYQQYDPATYQENAYLIESEFGDVGRVEVLDNIRFWPIDWQANRGDFGTLFVADPIRIPPVDSNDPKEFKVTDEIMFLDDKETAFRIIEVLDKDNVNKK